MTTLFNDTEKQILALFAHTLDRSAESFNPTHMIDADKVQIESLTDRNFFMQESKYILLTDHLCFVDDGSNISFYRLFLECFSVCRCGVKNCENEV